MITRRRFITSSAAACFVAGHGSVLNAFADTNSLQGAQMNERIAKIIAAYDAQGIHRTGTVGDRASAKWLAQEFENLGIAAELDVLEFDRLEVHTATLSTAGVTISGVPLYDCTYTGPNGIEGSLGPVGSDADIAAVMLSPLGVTPELVKVMAARKQGSHQALVLVTDDRMPAGGVATFNAESFRNPYGPPTLQVPNDQWQLIQKAMGDRATAHIVVDASYVPGVAENVQAIIPGSEPDLAPVVVMTPRSGWWRCASERGGGIAALLEIARAIKKSKPKRTVIFTANTGHELGHTGLDHYLEANHDLIVGAYMWIHLGANFAAKVGPGVRLQFSDEQARQIIHKFTEAQGLNAALESPMGERPLGEARNIFDGGGRYISILGANGLFHHPADTWPDAVDIPTTQKWVNVMVDAAVKIANQSG